MDWQLGEAHLSNLDPFFARLIENLGPCTLQPVAQEQYFTALVRGIVSQQVAPQVAEEILGRLADYFQHNIQPEQFLSASVEKLTQLGLSTQKIGYLRDLSNRIIDGTISLSALPGMADADIIRQLTEVKGVGRWTAEMFLILALCRTDVLPAEDFGLQKAVKLWHKLDKLPGRRELNIITEPWRPWRSLATWYLWSSLPFLDEPVPKKKEKADPPTKAKSAKKNKRK